MSVDGNDGDGGGGGSSGNGDGGGGGNDRTEQRKKCPRKRQQASAFCGGHTKGNQVS